MAANYRQIGHSWLKRQDRRMPRRLIHYCGRCEGVGDFFFLIGFSFMVTIHIDLPIFSTPTEPLGYFSGEIELDSMPRVGEAFPWPKGWLKHFPDVFDRQAGQVWSVDKSLYAQAELRVTMFGLVAHDPLQAQELARHIEQVSGIPFEQYGQV